MSTEIKTIPFIHGDPNNTLDGLLMHAATLGECSLYRLQGGWSFKISMVTTHVGADFSVRSEFNHPSPRSAVLQCLERANHAIAGVMAGKQ